MKIYFMLRSISSVPEWVTIVADFRIVAKYGSHVLRISWNFTEIRWRKGGVHMYHVCYNTKFHQCRRERRQEGNRNAKWFVSRTNTPNKSRKIASFSVLCCGSLPEEPVQQPKCECVKYARIVCNTNLSRLALVAHKAFMRSLFWYKPINFHILFVCIKPRESKWVRMFLLHSNLLIDSLLILLPFSLRIMCERSFIHPLAPFH